jgi:OOP family OmpA-OmpF porin
MMNRNIKIFCLVLVISMTMAITNHIIGIGLSMAEDMDFKIASGDYIQRVNNFIIILDASRSGNDLVFGQKKIDIAKDITRRMNRAIPDSLRLISAIRTYGKGEKLSSPIKTELVYGPEPYSKSSFEAALETIQTAKGLTFMGPALTAAGQDTEEFGGKTALILISDGKVHTTDPIPTAETIKEKYGNNLFIHTIFIPSDTKDINQIAKDTSLLQRIAQIGEGDFVAAEDIASDEGMNAFVEKIFLASASDSDDDQDGVYNIRDDCPGTPKGASVNKRGCWIVENLLFEFNKWHIDSQYYPDLDEIVRILKENKNLKIEIQGYTDNVGTEEYNQKLSEKRASAVMEYFSKKGIQKARLSIKGYGSTKPIAPNDTLEGRAKNRRVELHPVY